MSAAEREDWRTWLWEQQIGSKCVRTLVKPDHKPQDSEYGSTSGFRPSPHLDNTTGDGLSEVLAML